MINVNEPVLDFKLHLSSISVWVQYLRDDIKTTDMEWLKKYTHREMFYFVDGNVDKKYFKPEAKKKLMQLAEKAVDDILNKVFGE